MTKAILISGAKDTGKRTAIRSLYDYYISNIGRSASVLWEKKTVNEISAILKYDINSTEKIVVLISEGDTPDIISDQKDQVEKELKGLSIEIKKVDYWIFTSRSKNTNHKNALSIASGLDKDYTEYPTFYAHYSKSTGDIRYSLPRINTINSLFIQNIISTESL